MSRLVHPACAGAPRCSMGSVHIPLTSAAYRGRLLSSAKRQLLCPGLLLSPQHARRISLCAIASSQKVSRSTQVSLLAPLPQWCHRLTGAFVLAPRLMLGGSRNAVAHSIRTSAVPVRAAAAVAVAMVGYGYARSSGAGAGAGETSSRTAVVSRAVTVSSAASAPPADDPFVCSLELSRLSKRLTELEQRNDFLLTRARELMEQDSSLGFVEATYKAAESLDLDASAAEAAIVANALTAVLPTRPSGGASRQAPAPTAVAADVTAAAAAAVAGEVQAGVPLRPSGGASRLAPLEDSSVVRQSSYVAPERAGGASARSGPTAPLPQVPLDSTRVPPPIDMAAWAASELEKAGPTAAAAGPTKESAPGGTSGQIANKPLAAEDLKPSTRRTRRAAAGASSRKQRTYRTIAPPSLPTAPPPRINPSFDVPEDSPSPEEYLTQADGRTGDGRVNPSFAAAEIINAAAKATERTSASAPAAEPTWYNPLSWFTQQDLARNGGRTGTNPSFDSSLALEAVEVEVARGPELAKVVQAAAAAETAAAAELA
ncbi:hypothetical protein Vafri_16944, partial [Volvox africanus]